MRSQPLDIVIYPSPEIRNNAIDLSNSLSKNFDIYFALNEEGPFPHISLYQAEFPIKNLPEIKSSLDKFVKLMKPFKIKPVREFYAKEDNDYIEVTYEKSKELEKLQSYILEMLNSLRCGLLRGRDKERYNLVSPAQKENLDKWGYRSVGSEFRPHLTLTRLKNPDSTSGRGPLRKDFSFEVKQIGLFHLGEHGTCTEIINTYNLLG